jgi:cation transport ATPase
VGALGVLDFVYASGFLFWKNFFFNAWKQALHGSANMDTLVAVSTGVAYFFSVFTTLFPEFWHHRGLHAHIYFEASAIVIVFVLIGKLLEENAKSIPLRPSKSSLVFNLKRFGSSLMAKNNKCL